jgi:uncharacterized protein (TIGR02001 family)
MRLNKLSLALSLAALSLPLTAIAQDTGDTAAAQTEAVVTAPADQPADAEPASNLTWNLSATSDYVFRGVTQSNFKPALQGGLNYVFGKSGLYAGTWTSNVDYNNPDGPDIELDLFFGYGTHVSDDWAVDFSVIRYSYLGSRAVYGNTNYNEFIAKSIYKDMLTFTVAYANDYGNLDYSSLYFSVGGSWDLGEDFSLNAGVGHSRFSDGNGNYSDWNLGLGRKFGPVKAAINYYDTNLPGGKASDTIVFSLAIGS